MARGGLLDLLMIRYNAAHRGAETEVFPTTDALGLPVIAYTALRWGALLRPTPDDPPGFVVPRAPAWYRFTLQAPSVTVALMSPESRAELKEDLTVLDAGPLSPEEYDVLADHGRTVLQTLEPVPADVLEAGAPLAFGSDFPVEDIDPRRGLLAAVERRTQRYILRQKLTRARAELRMQPTPRIGNVVRRVCAGEQSS